MDKTFSPQNIEQQCYQAWENNGYFKASGEGQPYCIFCLLYTSDAADE